MARLFTAGAEVGHSASSDTQVHPECTRGANTSLSQVQVRTGAWSLVHNSGAGNAIAVAAAANSARWAASATTYLRVYFYFDNLPSTTARVIGTTATTDAYTGRLTPGGKLQLWRNDTEVQVGSDSAATITTGVWYRIELMMTHNGTSWTNGELRLDGTTVATGTAAGTGAAGYSTYFGWVSAPGANSVCYTDDVAVNNSTGTDQNSWPGDGNVVLLKAVSLNANGGSWTTSGNANTSALLTAAVDNTPPTGVADTTANEGHQIRNAAANTSIDYNLTDYATAGIGASDTINVLTPIVNVAAPASTGGKSGSFGITSNPTIAQRAFTGGTGTATFFWRGTAAGTYPTGWGWEIGTVTYNPTVTLATSPVARLSITAGTASRIALSDFLGIYVDYTPAGAPAAASLVPDMRRTRLAHMLRR